MNSAFIEVVFENLESIVIKRERFEELSFHPLKRVEDRTVPYDVFATDHLHFRISYHDPSELSYRARDHSQPLGAYRDNPDSNRLEDRPDILGRLVNDRDITSIDFLDEQEEMISSVLVPWNEADDLLNEYMTVTTDSGCVDVQISRKS